MAHMDPLDPLAPHKPNAPATGSLVGATGAQIPGRRGGKSRRPNVMTMRRVLAIRKRKNFPFVAWVAISTGTVFLALALPAAALGAFVVGACCAYAGRRTRRQRPG
jgi:hypothetical protein